MNEKKILITSVGNTPGSFFTLMDALIKEKLEINEIRIIATKGRGDHILKEVLPCIEKEMSEYLPYKSIAFKKPKIIEIEDITSEAEIVHYMEELAEVFDDCKRETDSVYVSISSGRKEMSTIADRLSMIYGIFETFHVRIIDPNNPENSPILENQIFNACQILNKNQCVNKNLLKNEICQKDLNLSDCRNNPPQYFSKIIKEFPNYEYKFHLSPEYLRLLRVPVFDLDHLADFNTAIDIDQINPFQRIRQESKQYFVQRGFFKSNGELTKWGFLLKRILPNNSYLGKTVNEMSKQNAKLSELSEKLTISNRINSDLSNKLAESSKMTKDDLIEKISIVFLVTILALAGQIYTAKSTIFYFSAITILIGFLVYSVWKFMKQKK